MILEIDGAHSGIRFSACHFIPGHEKCARLHGHSYIVRLRLEGDIGDSGMLMDFVVLKKALRTLAEELDHKTLLPALSENVKITKKGKEIEAVSCGKRYVFPDEDVVMLDIPTTTAEEMTKKMVSQIIGMIAFPKNIRSVSIGLDEERGQTAWSSVELR